MLKNKTILILIVIVLILAGVFLLGKKPLAGTKSSASVTVSMTPDGFVPAEITITAGTTINFINNDKQPRWPASNLHPTHTIYPEFDPKEPIDVGKSWSFKFDRVGSWRYHDHLSPYMTGVVNVK